MITFEHVAEALALENFDSYGARLRMAPAPRGWQKRDHPPIPAAVLILVFAAEADGRLKIVLTLRNAELRGHSGQVSFPGGRRDAQDRNLTETARRETCEEIGICGEQLSVLGRLPRFYIPASHHDVLPVIARCIGRPAFSPKPEEVAEVFAVALSDLLLPRYKSVERRLMRGINVRVPYYDVGGHKVWGATAMLLSELEARLRYVLPGCGKAETT